MNYKQFIKDPRCKAGARCFGCYSTLVQQYEILFVIEDNVFGKEVMENALLQPDTIRLPAYEEYFFNEADAIAYAIGNLQDRIAKYEERLKSLGGVNFVP